MRNYRFSQETINFYFLHNCIPRLLIYRIFLIPDKIWFQQILVRHFDSVETSNSPWFEIEKSSNSNNSNKTIWFIKLKQKANCCCATATFVYVQLQPTASHQKRCHAFWMKICSACYRQRMRQIIELIKKYSLNPLEIQCFCIIE